MAVSGRLWLIVCAAAIVLFAGVWVFCQLVLDLSSDDSSAIAGAVIAILSLPLAAWVTTIQSVGQVSPEPVAPAIAAAVEPEQVPPLRTYLDLVKQRFQYVDIDVLTPLAQQAAEHPPVLLTEVFVQQDTKADPSWPGWPRDPARQPSPHETPHDWELPRSLDQDTLLKIRADYEQAPSVPVLSLLAGEEAKRVVLFGDPGVGKSTLGRYVALTLAQDQVVGPLAPLAGWLPILVELRELAHHGGEAFPEFLARLHQSGGLGLPLETLESILDAHGQVLIIFDGIDEIFDPGLRNRTVKKIAQFANSHSHARVMVTSRPIDFRRTDLESAGFSWHKLQDHDSEKIRIFIDNWYRVACQNDSSRASRLAERLAAAIGASSSVRELAGNPLLLTVLAVLGSRQRLPRDRTKIYEHAVTALVGQWDSTSFLNDRINSHVPYLDAADNLEMLRLIARRMQDSPTGLSGNFISADDLIDEIASYLLRHDSTGMTANEAQAAASVMLRQFRERSSVLGRFGNEVYGFVHRWILEYLTAADIVRRFTSERTLSETDLAEEIFAVRWREPAWHEVLILVCGMLDHRFASRVILELFEADGRWMASDTAEPRQILLAIRCLAESRHIGRQAAACRIAVEKLIHVLTVAHRRITRTYSDDLNRAVEQTLLPIFESFGPSWPGRERFLDWYMGAGTAEVDDPATMAVATKIALALRGPEDGLFTFLCAGVSAGWRPDLRQAAVWAIAHSWTGNGKGLALVRQAAGSDPDKEVRQTAMKAVTTARPDDPQTLALLRDIATSDQHEDLRHTAVEALVRDWADDDGTAGLLRAIATDDPDADVRQAAIHGLAEIDPDSHATIDLLGRLAADPHDDVRLAALGALLPVQERDFESLRFLTGSEAGEDIRRLLVTTVAQRHSSDPRTLPWLKELACTDEAPGVRQTAAQAIAAGWAEAEGTRGFLLARVDDKTEAGVVRESIVKAMGAQGFTTGDTLRRFRLYAEGDSDIGVRQAAALAIAVHWRRDTETLPWLRIRAEVDPEPRVRHAVIREVARGWPDVPTVVGWLMRRAEEDRFDPVRRVAVQMIAALGTDDPEARLWHEERAVHDPSWEVREAALRAMVEGWPTHPRNLGRLNQFVMNDPHEQVRHTAMLAIIDHWREEPGVWPLLRDVAIRDASERLRGAAVRILVDGWPTDDTMSVVVGCAVDGQPGVRRSTLRALSNGWPADREILRLLRLHAVADRDEYVRLTAVQELARRWHHDPDLTALLHDRARLDRHQAVRLVALRAVVIRWGSEPRTWQLVRWLAVNDPHPAVRAEAARLLAEHRPDDPGDHPAGA